MENVYKATIHRRGNQVANKLLKCYTPLVMREMQTKQNKTKQ